MPTLRSDNENGNHVTLTDQTFDVKLRLKLTSFTAGWNPEHVEKMIRDQIPGEFRSLKVKLVETEQREISEEMAGH